MRVGGSFESEDMLVICNTNHFGAFTGQVRTKPGRYVEPGLDVIDFIF